MKAKAFSLLAVVAVLMLLAPAMAAGQGACSFVGGPPEGVTKWPSPESAIGGIVAHKCGENGGSPVVSTSEPLAALAVGLGLLGARLLRRR